MCRSLVCGKDLLRIVLKVISSLPNNLNISKYLLMIFFNHQPIS